MIQPDYANPSAIQILRGAPNANWRKCWDCGSESLHMDNVTPWVLCQHCKSQDTRLMKVATELLRQKSKTLDTDDEERLHWNVYPGGKAVVNKTLDTTKDDGVD